MISALLSSKSIIIIIIIIVIFISLCRTVSKQSPRLETGQKKSSRLNFKKITD